MTDSEQATNQQQSEDEVFGYFTPVPIPMPNPLTSLQRLGQTQLGAIDPRALRGFDGGGGLGFDGGGGLGVTLLPR